MQESIFKDNIFSSESPYSGHIPQSTKFEEWGELTKRREYYAPVPPAQAEGAWYYGTINAGDVDEDGRFEVGGKVLVAGKDDRVFAYQLSVGHHCKNGSEQVPVCETFESLLSLEIRINLLFPWKLLLFHRTF